MHLAEDPSVNPRTPYPSWGPGAFYESTKRLRKNEKYNADRFDLQANWLFVHLKSTGRA